jgi:hypothetical protein
MKCKNIDDFLVLYRKHYDKKYYKNHPNEDWTSGATIIWDSLVKQNRVFFEKHGYIDIEFNPDKNEYFRIKLPKGRPPKDNNMDNRICIRLDDHTMEQLNILCRTKNKTQSEVIRDLILQDR